MRKWTRCKGTKIFWHSNGGFHRTVTFQRLTDIEPKDGMENQYHVIEALEYLPYYQSHYQLVVPLLQKDLGNWLRWTVKRDENLSGKVFLTADIDVMRTIFNTYDEYKSLTIELMDYYKDNDEQKAIIEEHRILVERTSLIAALPVSSFEQSEFPHLKNIVYQESWQLIVMHHSYDDAKEYLSKQEHPFFRNESRLPELFL